MALNSLGLGMVFSAKDQASPVVGRLTNRIHKLNGAQGRLRDQQGRFMRQGGMLANTMAAQHGAIGGAALGLGRLSKFILGGAAAYKTLGFAVDSVNMAGRFQQQLVATQKIMGATTEELDKMRETVIKVGLKTKFSPEEIAQGMQDMGAMGLKANEAIAAIEPSALLATAGQIQLDDASRAIVGTLKAFQMETTKSGVVADKLTRITQMTNFQAQDFSNGLSKAAASMATFGQGVDDTLVIMGLMRNLNVDASSASTALREAIRRLASDEAAMNTVKKAGVPIYDKSTGKMRDLTDIMVDLAEKTAGMTEEERNSIAAKAFGARGLIAFNAVAGAAFRTTRDGTEVLLKGREAVEAMGDELMKSAGTAKDFNDAMLDTFEGQKTILKGAVDTLKVLMGEGFASMFKPAVKLAADSVSAMAKFVKDLPDETKTAISRFTMLLAGVAAALGIVLFLGAGAAGVIAGLGAAIYTAVKLVQSNVLGIGDAFRRTFDKVVLFFKGLTQLIFDGELSGDTMTQLMEEDNRGVLRVLQNLVQFGYRVQRFFEGLGEGFTTMMEQLRPTFESLGAAFTELGEALGITSGAMGLMTTPSEKFAAAGRAIGEAIAKVISVSARLIAFVARVHAGFIRAWKFIAGHFEPVWAHLRESFDIFVGAVKEVLVSLGLMDDNLGEVEDSAGGVGAFIGGVLATAVHVAATAFAVFARVAARVAQVFSAVVRGVVWLGEKWDWLKKKTAEIHVAVGTKIVNAFEAAGRGIKSAFEPVVDFLQGAFDGILNIIDRAIVRVSELASKLPGAESIPGVSQLVELGEEARGRIVERDIGRPGFSDIIQVAGAHAGAAAAAEGTQRSREAEAQNDKLASSIASALTDAAARPGGAQNMTQVIKLLLDGETIATAIANGQQSATARGFGG